MSSIARKAAPTNRTNGQINFRAFDSVVRLCLPSSVLRDSGPQLELMGITSMTVSVMGVSTDGTWYQVKATPAREGIVPKLKVGIGEIHKEDEEIYYRQMRKLNAVSSS
ncbi:MAG: hypothetical protein ACM3KM_01425 [Acidobacteriaceae bacterium]